VVVGPQEDRGREPGAGVQRAELDPFFDVGEAVLSQGHRLEMFVLEARLMSGKASSREAR